MLQHGLTVQLCVYVGHKRNMQKQLNRLRCHWGRKHCRPRKQARIPHETRVNWYDVLDLIRKGAAVLYCSDLRGDLVRVRWTDQALWPSAIVVAVLHGTPLQFSRRSRRWDTAAWTPRRRPPASRCSRSACRPCCKHNKAIRAAPCWVTLSTYCCGYNSLHGHAAHPHLHCVPIEVTPILKST